MHRNKKNTFLNRNFKKNKQEFTAINRIGSVSKTRRQKYVISEN